MSDPTVNVEAEVEAAVKKGQFPDKQTAIAGMMKQLVDYQKGVLKDKIQGDPVETVESMRSETWKELTERAGGDEDKAISLYVEELKKLGVMPQQ